MKKQNKKLKFVKSIFKAKWVCKLAFPVSIFSLCTLFAITNLGNYKVIITLGLIKNNPSNWNYLTQNSQIYRFLTSSVIHNDLTHYLGNMICLVTFWLCAILDKQKRIEITYISAVVLGGLAQLHLIVANQAVSTGASGGIMGICGLYLYKRIKKREWLTALLFLVGYGMGDYLQILNKSNVGWIAHLFGLLVGLAFGIINAKTTNKKVENSK